MRGLSLLQPWASLMALGEKRIETRSWKTPYRGPIAIAASARWRTEDLELAVDDANFLDAWSRHGIRQMKELPLGAIVCAGILVDCVKTEYFAFPALRVAPNEEAFGDYATGRYAWVFENVKKLVVPIPIKGALGLYALPENVERTLQSRLAA